MARTIRKYMSIFDRHTDKDGVLLCILGRQPTINEKVIATKVANDVCILYPHKEYLDQYHKALASIFLLEKRQKLYGTNTPPDIYAPWL